MEKKLAKERKSHRKEVSVLKEEMASLKESITAMLKSQQGQQQQQQSMLGGAVGMQHALNAPMFLGGMPPTHTPANAPMPSNDVFGVNYMQMSVMQSQAERTHRLSSLESRNALLENMMLMHVANSRK